MSRFTSLVFLVALLPALLVACGDDDAANDEEEEGPRSQRYVLRQPSWWTGPSRYWTFSATYYAYPEFPDRTCVVLPDRANVVYPAGGIALDCSIGCVTGHVCAFGCKMDLGACAEWQGANAPQIDIIYTLVGCSRGYGLGGLILPMPTITGCQP